MINFKLPDGYSLPDDLKEGEPFSAMFNLRLNKDNNVAIEDMEGHDMSKSKPIGESANADDSQEDGEAPISNMPNVNDNEQGDYVGSVLKGIRD